MGASATRIEFHFHVPDGHAHACRLLRKAVGQGVRCAVLAGAATLEALDQKLWTFSGTDFIAHSRVGDDPVATATASVLLTSSLTELKQPVEALIHLGEQVPVGFERFARLIEIGTTDDLSRAQARLRWKHYSAMGYELVRHDLSSGATA